MSLHRIRKSFTFEAAHQLESAFTEACFECVHGHSYKVELYVASRTLDPDGMVLDFSKLKAFKEGVMEKWDHGLLLHVDKRKHFQPLVDAGVLKGSKVNYFDVNPTAENFAVGLYYQLKGFLRALQAKNDPFVERVRVHETSTGWAEYDGGL